MTPSLVIVGTVALDDVKTPFGEVHNALGGSAFFAGISASYWTSVGVMAIVGSDYPSNLFSHSCGQTHLFHLTHSTTRQQTPARAMSPTAMSVEIRPW